MKKLFKILCWSLVGFLVSVVFALGYIGFVPGISSVIGPKPVNLGIVPTEADMKSGLEKAKIIFSSTKEETTPENSLRFSGSVPIKGDFTSAEITSRIQSDPWKYNISRDAQVRFNDDGTMEISGTLTVDRIAGYAKANGIPDAAVDAVMGKIGPYIKTNPAYYLKTGLAVANNKVSLSPKEFSVGRVPFPEAFLRNNSGAVSSYIENRVRMVPGMSIKSLSISDGKVRFDGTMPAQITVAE